MGVEHDRGRGQKGCAVRMKESLYELFWDEDRNKLGVFPLYLPHVGDRIMWVSSGISLARIIRKSLFVFHATVGYKTSISE